MRKTIFITSGIVLAGILSYFGGYYYYTSVNSQTKQINPISVQRTVQFMESDFEETEEQYHAKIEQDMLIIYKIPENVVYDSVKLSTLHLIDSESTALLNGINFDSLMEVFEFLENSMS